MTMDVEGRSSGQLQGKDEQCASVGMSAPTRLGNDQGVPEETVVNVECVEESVDKREMGRKSVVVTLHSTLAIAEESSVELADTAHTIDWWRKKGKDGRSGSGERQRCC